MSRPPASPARRRLLGQAGGVLLPWSMLGAGCISPPREFEISQAQMLQGLGAHFPLRRRLAGLVELEADHPRLRLLPERNRLALALDLRGTGALPGPSGWTGVTGLSTGLRFDRDQASVRLDDVALERLEIDGLSSATGDRLARLLGPLVSGGLQDLVVRRFSEQAMARVHRRGVRPAGLRITATGLVVDLEPLPS